jgi:uncharacterized protein
MWNAPVNHLFVVGEARSLEIAPRKVLLEEPDFPEAYEAEAQAGGGFLNTLRKEKGLDLDIPISFC